MGELVYDKNAEIEVTKEFTFDSCHCLKEYEGKCKNMHGHTYILQISMKGKVDYRGLVIDFNDIKAIVNEHIIEKLDHVNLNDVLDFNTTAENMSVWIYDILAEELFKLSTTIRVTRVRLWETPTSFATYEGGK